MLYATTRTTTRNSSGPANPERMGVWGCQVDWSGVYLERPCRKWLFVKEDGQRYRAYERLSKCAAHAPENGCTFYGEGARHVRLERMSVSKRRHHRLPIMNSWSKRWDAAKKADVWTFVCEHGQVFTAELMQSNCEHCAPADGTPQVWVRTRSEPV